MRPLSVAAAAAVLVLVAICSGEPKCARPPNCALIQCGIPRCSTGHKLRLIPCTCCPSCVPDPDFQQVSAPEELVRQRRQLQRKSGSAQRQSKSHRHFAQGSNIPEMFQHLLKNLPQ